jgi:FkbM family methyltransferase
MTIRELFRLYRALDGRDFWGRSMRQLFEFAIPQVSYSQSGEDVIVGYLLQQAAVRQPSYLELGTNHPRQWNNTYKFYRSGCHGVLVEADPSMVPCIRRMRRRDTVLNVGVSAGEERVAKFYVMSHSGLNTFNEETARERAADPRSGIRVKSVVDVPLLSVNSIIQQHFRSLPDFLSIDVEGLDLVVLQSLDFVKYPIPIICAETCAYSETPVKPKDNAVENLLLSKGYFVYADTYINTIFVNRQWFSRLGSEPQTA